MKNKKINQLHADIRDHIADEWGGLSIYEQAEYIGGLLEWVEAMNRTVQAKLKEGIENEQ